MEQTNICLNPNENKSVFRYDGSYRDSRSSVFPFKDEESHRSAHFPLALEVASFVNYVCRIVMIEHFTSDFKETSLLERD